MVYLYRNEATAGEDAREAVLTSLDKPDGSGAAGASEATHQDSASSADRKSIGEAGFDGLLMLSTNDTKLSQLALWTRYRQLEAVEDAFGTAASLIDRKRVFGDVDEFIRGHLCCSILALRLRNALGTAIEKLGEQASWPETLWDLRA